MFRDRTNLYISYRQSYAHHPQLSTGGTGMLSRLSGETPDDERGLLTGEARPDEIAIEMDVLPPSWVDVSEEVDELLAEVKGKITRLQVLHKRNILPGFDDRTHDERQIEELTYDITSTLHQCQGLIKRFEQMTAGASTPAEQKMSANMKISLATRVQEMSTTFRKMQSNYLKALRSDSYPTERGPSPGLGGGSSSGGGGYDPVAEDAADVAMSQSALQESSRLAVVEDVNLRQREQEISKIAQGILEVAEIFRDMQTMVIDQGTLLDRIDYNIETMYTNVKGADKELVQATHYQKRTQKCKIILLLVLIIVGLIIILILKPKRHHSYTEPAPAPQPAQPNTGDSVPDRPTIPTGR